MENNNRIRLFELFDKKINIIEEMIKLEKNKLTSSRKYRKLSNEYKIVHDEYKLLLTSLSEEEKQELKLMITMVFEKENITLHFSDFIETDFYNSQVNRILLDIDKGLNNLYRNDLLAVIDINPEIENGIRNLGPNCKDVFEKMNLDFLVSFYNLLSKKIAKTRDNDYLLKIKYNLILLFSDLEDFVVDNSFSKSLKTKFNDNYDQFTKLNYNITFDMYNVAMIQKIFYDQTINLDNDLLLLEVLSNIVKNKDRIKFFKDDLEEFLSTLSKVNPNQKQKLKAITYKN